MDLSELKEGQTATVARVGGDGPFRRRLLEMGFLRGTDVYVWMRPPAFKSKTLGIQDNACQKNL